MILAKTLIQTPAPVHPSLHWYDTHLEDLDLTAATMKQAITLVIQIRLNLYTEWNTLLTTVAVGGKLSTDAMDLPT